MSILRDRKRGTQYSAWRLIDILLMLGVCFCGSLSALLYRWVMLLWVLAAFWAAAAFALPRLYDKGCDRTAAFRIGTGILRAVGYLVIVGGVALTFCVSGRSQSKLTYPLRRAVFLSSYSRASDLQRCLPEQLPDRCEQFTSQFTPKFAQGAAAAQVRFYTDSATVAEYKAYAQAHCKKHLENGPAFDETGSRLDPTSKWFAMMQKDGADIDGADAYILYEGYENDAVWMLNEKTGYFCMYW